MTDQKKKRKVSKWGSLILKIWTVQLLQIVMLLAHGAAIVLAFSSAFFPGEEAIKSVASSFAEILAGLYGITLAGYTFFLSRIDGLMASDTSLDFVVINVKNRFKHLIYFITGHVLATLLISLVLMCVSMPQDALWQFLYRLFCNEVVLNAVFSLSLILYYSVRVVDPNCLEKEAKKQKAKLSSPEGMEGSVAAFISLYGKIVDACNARLTREVLEQICADKGHRFELSLALLRQTQPELEPLLGEITRIHQYYECVVNCSPMTVTQEMCLIAQGVLTQLETDEANPEMP